MKTLAYYEDRLREYIGQYAGQMLCEPGGQLNFPYIVPGSKFYSTTLWDWDSWLSNVALRQYGLENSEFRTSLPHFELGCLENFTQHTSQDGFMPIMISKEENSLFSVPTKDHLTNMHKPVFAQHAAFLQQQGVPIPDSVRDVAAAFVKAYETYFFHEKTGLFFWQDDFAIGVDNDPAAYFRPARSCASIYLNSLMYREILAVGSLYENSGDMKTAMKWKGRADALRDAVNRHCFDPRDQMYYSVDLNLLPNENVVGLHSGAPRHWDCLLMRFDVWSNILPLWAGIANPDQAQGVMARFRDERTFNARYGIRTLSRMEKMYNLAATNNPSNWLGPVWGVANYLSWHAMVKYGFEEDAQLLAQKTIRLFGEDLDRTGTLHEYYNPDTGEAIITPNFINWNALVLNMAAWLEGKPFCTEF